MPLQGKFVVNNRPLAPLSIFGIGTFMAFSGNDIYRNRGGCAAIMNNGPLPAGRYWIVDRPTSGVGTRLRTLLQDAWNTASGTPTDHTEWFALYRDDCLIDDYTWIEGVRRGNFRLHPMGGRGVSLGCITLHSHSDFQSVRRALLHTTTIPIHNTGLNAYGMIEVIAHGKTCP